MDKIQLDPYLEDKGWKSTAWLGLFAHDDYPNTYIGKMDDGTYQVTKGKKRVGEGLSVEDAVGLATQRGINEMFLNAEQELKQNEWDEVEHGVFRHRKAPGWTIRTDNSSGIMSVHGPNGHSQTVTDVSQALELVQMSLRNPNVRPNRTESTLMSRLNALMEEQDMRDAVTPVPDGAEQFATLATQLRRDKARWEAMLNTLNIGGDEARSALFWMLVGRSGVETRDQIVKCQGLFKRIF